MRKYFEGRCCLLDKYKDPEEFNVYYVTDTGEPRVSKWRKEYLSNFIMSLTTGRARLNRDPFYEGDI